MVDGAVCSRGQKGVYFPKRMYAGIHPKPKKATVKKNDFLKRIRCIFPKKVNNLRHLHGFTLGGKYRHNNLCSPSPIRPRIPPTSPSFFVSSSFCLQKFAHMPRPLFFFLFKFLSLPSRCQPPSFCVTLHCALTPPSSIFHFNSLFFV